MNFFCNPGNIAGKWKKLKKEKSLVTFCVSVLKVSIIRLAFRFAMRRNYVFTAFSSYDKSKLEF